MPSSAALASVSFAVDWTAWAIGGGAEVEDDVVVSCDLQSRPARRRARGSTSPSRCGRRSALRGRRSRRRRRGPSSDRAGPGADGGRSRRERRARLRASRRCHRGGRRPERLSRSTAVVAPVPADASTQASFGLVARRSGSSRARPRAGRHGGRGASTPVEAESKTAIQQIPGRPPAATAMWASGGKQGLAHRLARRSESSSRWPAELEQVVGPAPSPAPRARRKPPPVAEEGAAGIGLAADGPGAAPHRPSGRRFRPALGATSWIGSRRK